MNQVKVKYLKGMDTGEFNPDGKVHIDNQTLLERKNIDERGLI